MQSLSCGHDVCNSWVFWFVFGVPGEGIVVWEFSDHSDLDQNPVPDLHPSHPASQGPASSSQMPYLARWKVSWCHGRWQWLCTDTRRHANYKKMPCRYLHAQLANMCVCVCAFFFPQGVCMIEWYVRIQKNHIHRNFVHGWKAIRFCFWCVLT